MPAPSVLFINRYYWPDVSATAQMLTDLAEGLAAGGWRVVVLTGRRSYDGRETFTPREVRAGVDIRRVWSTSLGRQVLPFRVTDYATFATALALQLLRAPRTDVIVAMTDPPLTVGPALAAARIRQSACVHWVQDLYPEVLARLGYVSATNPGYRAMRGFMRRFHAAVDASVALGPAMRTALVAAGAPAHRTECIHNWADCAAVRPMDGEPNPFALRHGLADRFVVLYSGNAGRPHTFDAVIEAARRLRREPDIVFLFIGGGHRIPELRHVADTEGLNMRFMDYVPRSELRYSLSAASVSLVTERPEVVGTLVPSKTYGILASGRPVVFVGSEQSDVADAVRGAGCGVIVPPDDAAALVAALRRLRADPGERQRMGVQARQAAERFYDRATGVATWSALLAGLIPAAQSALHRGLPSGGSAGSFTLLQAPHGSRTANADEIST
jgi:colanic acid biosynthesis glycosyl transferase WcaI